MATMTIFYRATRLLMAMCLLACSLIANADDRVGTITNLSLADGQIEIDKRSYTISSSALVGKAPGNIASLKFQDLAIGQPVHVITSGSRVNTLRLLHNPSELPD